MVNRCDKCGCETTDLSDYFALLCPTCRATPGKITDLIQLARKAEQPKVLKQSTLANWR